MAQETRDIVMNWCVDEKLVPSLAEAGKLPASAEWIIGTAPAPGRHISIAQGTVMPDRIQLSAGLALAKGHADSFLALEPVQRQRFLYALRRDTMLLGVLYQGITDPLQKVGFTQRVYVEALTKTSFMSAFNAVQNALILARQIVQINLNFGDVGGGSADLEADGPFGDFLSGLDLGDL